MTELKNWVLLWAILTATPIIAVWTVGLPLADEVFWFNDAAMSASVAWGWLMLLAVVVATMEARK